MTSQTNDCMINNNDHLVTRICTINKEISFSGVKNQAKLTSKKFLVPEIAASWWEIRYVHLQIYTLNFI